MRCFVKFVVCCVAAGKGCFKCGSLDHIAKDCTGSPDAKRAPKDTLKDDSFTRKGGNDSSRLVGLVDVVRWVGHVGWVIG